MNKILIGICLIALSRAAFNNVDFQNCYSTCTNGYAVGVVGQSADYTDTDGNTVTQADFLEQIYRYENCVRGLSVEEFQNKYNSGVDYSATAEALSDLQPNKGFCKFFWDKDLDITEFNQSQLENLVKMCFDNDDAEKGCKFTADTPDTDGTSHYSSTFVGCLDSCISLTIQEDEKLHQDCEATCNASYDIAYAALSADDTTKEDGLISKYDNCVDQSEKCSELDFLTFEDFQYETIYNECHTPCITAYKEDAGSLEVRTDYFTCLESCPFPDADSFVRLDNAVEQTGAQILTSSIVLVISMLMFVGI